MKNTWDLSLLYKDEEEFEKDFVYIKETIIPQFSLLAGKLNETENLKKYLLLEREATPIISRLGMYCSMKSDLDKKDSKSDILLQRVDSLYSQLIEQTSYYQPEILSLGKEKIDSFLKDNPEFSDFDYTFEKLFNSQEYVLAKTEEQLLSYFTSLQQSGSSLYSKLTVADYIPKKIKLSNNREVEVNMANWTKLISESDNEEDREKIFLSLYSYYDEHKNVYAEIYNSVLQSQKAEMKARGYKSILQEHLSSNKIPEEVFLNLIDVASKENHSLKKYFQLKKEHLNLSKYHTYDRFLHLAKSQKKYTYDEAKELFYKSIDHLPEDFKNKAREATREGYVDVYHKLGKRTGAYSNGGYDIHPFILLNFNDTLEDVFTLAHEAGHSIHTLYSIESQPIVKQDYTIFVAEIASTFNEHNLLDYLMKSGTLSKEDKIALLEKAIDEVASTFYRQALFAHYEYNISNLAIENKPINHQILSDEMKKLYQMYYGLDIEDEKLKKLVWAYIPHLFYTPFYVYQYATSFTASMLIYQNVKKGLPGAFDKYINMLRSGGKTYPINEVKEAGVDLTRRDTFMSVVNYIDDLVSQLEKILND